MPGSCGLRGDAEVQLHCPAPPGVLLPEESEQEGLVPLGLGIGERFPPQRLLINGVRLLFRHRPEGDIRHPVVGQTAAVRGKMVHPPLQYPAEPADCIRRAAVCRFQPGDILREVRLFNRKGGVRPPGRQHLRRKPLFRQQLMIMEAVRRVVGRAERRDVRPLDQPPGENPFVWSIAPHRS